MRAAIPRQCGRGRRQGVYGVRRGTVQELPVRHMAPARPQAVPQGVPDAKDRSLPVVKARNVRARDRGTHPTRRSEPSRRPRDDGDGCPHRAPARGRARPHPQQAASCPAWRNHTGASRTAGGCGRFGARESLSKFQKIIAADCPTLGRDMFQFVRVDYLLCAEQQGISWIKQQTTTTSQATCHAVTRRRSSV